MEKQALIIVVIDQQNLDKNTFDIRLLPDYIRVEFINRKETLKSVYSGVIGKIHKAYATLPLGFSKYMTNRTKALLLEKVLKIEVSNSDQLYLFNDRNRLSRLFRVYYATYQVIEDGLSNYTGWELRFWQNIAIFNSLNKRYIGDSDNCSSIYLITPSMAPKALSGKVKKIDFISDCIVIKYLFPLFKVKEGELDNIDSIIATQPISACDFSLSGVDLIAYEEMKNCIELSGKSLAIKVHPREDVSRYKNIFRGVKFINSKLPLELVIFSNSSVVDIYSIYSTVGMGFEKFCKRHTLIKNAEASNQYEMFNKWKDNHEMLKQRVRETILS